MKHLFFTLILIFGSSSFAGDTSSGGNRPTAFQYDQRAIQTILEDSLVSETLADKGSIKEISRSGPNYLISTEKCDLVVKFVVGRVSSSPILDFSATILWDLSSADCKTN